MHRSVEAAVELSSAFGLQVTDPQLLRSTNNIVVWLRPAMIVAKIGVGHHRRLADELQVALELTRLRAPVVSPASEIPEIVHRRNDFYMTFWRYHPQPSDVIMSSWQLASALRRLHESGRQISSAVRAGLPSFLEELTAVRALLSNRSRVVLLSERDRLVLLHAFDQLAAELRRALQPDVETMIHGSPHRLNVLFADGEPRFIDLETVCIGPVEWDLAHLEPEIAVQYGEPRNESLERTCRDMASVKTATWCWEDANRGDLRDHAEFHLAEIRRRFAR